ncbi:PH domain-containing protein [Geodermatophilaceae bacterium NBWT11]|nr:PH domain-containing protein [Geodermatophilaceae bacterium NBWT11]
MNTAQLRMSRTALVPVVILLVCVVPIAGAAWWGLPLLLVPVVAAAWVLRVGVDVGAAGVTPRSLLTARTVPWDQVAGIRVGEDQDLWLVRTTGTEVRLPVVRARDLPQLSAASAGRIPDPSAP